MTTERERIVAVTCKACDGRGSVFDDLDVDGRAVGAICERCNGHGYVRAALAQPAQPVAWRFARPDGGWTYTTRKPTSAELLVEPLYAAPQPAPAASIPSELSDAECDAIAHREFPPEGLSTNGADRIAYYRALIRAGRATVAEDARWHIVGELVDRQAEDEALWFVAQTASEDYLQRELRYLHAAIDAARGRP